MLKLEVKKLHLLQDRRLSNIGMKILSLLISTAAIVLECHCSVQFRLTLLLLNCSTVLLDTLPKDWTKLALKQIECYLRTTVDEGLITTIIFDSYLGVKFSGIDKQKELSYCQSQKPN